ncbi:hypothetical protein OF83DRAFT_1069832 [Amylostereum chailletii]|nr:hypothetical protein OF83DRAFT_1069832 [Amylostereum chailletii]
MTSPYAPDESPFEIFTEKTWLQGAILGAVGYGIQFMLFANCFVLLCKQMSRDNLRQKLPFLIYICAIFSLGTIFMVCSASFTQFAFISLRNYPGGPNAVENDFLSAPIDEGGNVAFVMTAWLSDGLLIWRCIVIYKGCRVPTWAVALGPCLMLCGSTVCGILWLIQVSATSLQATQVTNWTIPYLSLTISLNILVTIAIVARLLLYRHRIMKTLGSQHTKHYTGIAAMIVESAAIYSSLAIVLLVTFAINSPIFNIFLQAVSQIQSSATLLIIFRVARGNAWSSDVNEQLTMGHLPTSDNKRMQNISGMRFSPPASETVLGRGRSTSDTVTSGMMDIGLEASPSSGKGKHLEPSYDNAV